MEFLGTIGWYHGKFLGVDWSAWKMIGWLGNAIFFSRFFVQWYATEKKKQVVIPALFWWLSLAGSMLLLAYAVFYQHDSVFIFAYLFTWIPYIRNLVIHSRHTKAQLICPQCKTRSGSSAKFCSLCGTKLAVSLVTR